jgi:hypothetical protein
MKDDAVAPVIAAMLLLAVLVTFFSAWNAVVIPSIKEQSEMMHLHGVEESFARFSSDIDAAASTKGGMQLSEPVPLGGGDGVFNSQKSGGTLRSLTEPSGYMDVGITSSVLVDTATFRLANFSYRPVGNFWQDQGYDWSYGYINVTKNDLKTPLTYATMADVPFTLAGSLLEFEPVHSGTDPTKCSGIIVRAVDIIADPDHASASGNGIGLLVLNSSQQSRQYPKTTLIRVTLDTSTPAGFRSALGDSAHSTSGDLGSECQNVHPVITGNIIDLQVDALPEVTVIRKITRIRIRAD